MNINFPHIKNHPYDYLNGILDSLYKLSAIKLILYIVLEYDPNNFKIPLSRNQFVYVNLQRFVITDLFNVLQDRVAI